MSATVDRRTRKKLMTYRSLASAARELTLERGLDDVTIDEITEAAGVSPRTFFNYFSCKEEAIVGIEPALLRAIAREVEARPEHEELARRWMLRAELITRYPELIPRHMAAVVELEHELTEAIATRIGVDPNGDPFPKLVVVWSVATLRSTVEWWHENGKPGPLRTALEDAFAILAEGVTAHARSGAI